MKESKIFFATDIHGSDRCLRKFLNAGQVLRRRRGRDGRRHHGQDDRPGRRGEPGGLFYAQLFGRKRVVDADGLAGLNKFIADAGFYPHPMTAEEIDVLKAGPGRRRATCSGS